MSFLFVSTKHLFLILFHKNNARKPAFFVWVGKYQGTSPPLGGAEEECQSFTDFTQSYFFTCLCTKGRYPNNLWPSRSSWTPLQCADFSLRCLWNSTRHRPEHTGTYYYYLLGGEIPNARLQARAFGGREYDIGSRPGRLLRRLGE